MKSTVLYDLDTLPYKVFFHTVDKVAMASSSLIHAEHGWADKHGG